MEVGAVFPVAAGRLRETKKRMVGLHRTLVEQEIIVPSRKSASKRDQTCDLLTLPDYLCRRKTPIQTLRLQDVIRFPCYPICRAAVRMFGREIAGISRSIYNQFWLAVRPGSKACDCLQRRAETHSYDVGRCPTRRVKVVLIARPFAGEITVTPGTFAAGIVSVVPELLEPVAPVSAVWFLPFSYAIKIVGPAWKRSTVVLSAMPHTAEYQPTVGKRTECRKSAGSCV